MKEYEGDFIGSSLVGNNDAPYVSDSGKLWYGTEVIATPVKGTNYGIGNEGSNIRVAAEATGEVASAPAPSTQVIIIQ